MGGAARVMLAALRDHALDRAQRAVEISTPRSTRSRGNNRGTDRDGDRGGLRKPECERLS